jgi:hypothetical protein
VRQGERPPSPLTLLTDGEVAMKGRLPWASNATFLVDLCLDGHAGVAVYKPRRGERPLWDFPHGSLAGREVTAYLVSEAARWHIVPPTVLREDGLLGPGSLQLFVEHDPERHYFVIMEERAEELVAFAAFDVVVNNADRKAGHVLKDRQGKLWGIDHGLTFNREPKLRTVLWQFVGEPISPSLQRELVQLQDRGDELHDTLGDVIDRREIEALLGRISRFANHGCYPALNPRRNVPYGWW